jgi:hypothetical protein
MSVQVILIGVNGNPINGGPKLSHHLQQVLSAAESIRAQRKSKETHPTSEKSRIEEEDILAAIAIGGGRVSEVLAKTGELDPDKLCKHLKIDRHLIPIDIDPTYISSNLPLSVRNDFSVMAAFYVQKALQLAEIAGEAEVTTEHLLYTTLDMNKTATAPRLVRDLTGEFHDPTDKVKKALGYDQHHYALFQAKRHTDF